jgi:hypothetical protein
MNVEVSRELSSILYNIDRLINYSDDGRVEIYNLKKELIATGKSQEEVKDYLKENVRPPKTTKEVIMVSYNLKKRWSNNKPFLVSVIILKISPDLEIKAKHGKVIHWTTEEVLEFKFKRSYLSKIIKAIQTRKISLGPLSTESITNILNLKY